MAMLHRQALYTKMPQNLSQGHRLNEETLGSKVTQRLALTAKLERVSLFPGTHAENERTPPASSPLSYTHAPWHSPTSHIQNK